MQLGQREGVAILAQVVADRDLAAEGIAPPLDVELVEVVRIGLDQNGYLQARKLDRIRHALFIAKVGQHHQNAVYLVGVGLEQGRALFGILPRLNSSQVGVLLSQHDRLDTHFVENRQDILPCLGHQLIGEKIAIADDDCQFCSFHCILLISEQVVRR